MMYSPPGATVLSMLHQARSMKPGEFIRVKTLIKIMLKSDVKTRAKNFKLKSIKIIN